MRACTDSLVISVGAGVQPLIKWTPNCRAEYLTVVHPDPSGGDLARWAIRARTVGQGAASPIQYGQAPSSMNVEFGPSPLVAGTEYRVDIYANTGALGTVLFTP